MSIYRPMMSLIILVFAVSNFLKGSEALMSPPYPFTGVDKKLFLNAELQRIDSPYSSKSINMLGSKRVTIESQDLKVLIKNARNRGQARSYAHRLWLSQSADTIFLLSLDTIEHFQRECNFHLEALKRAEEIIKISDTDPARNSIQEYTLMGLLQWCYRIERSPDYVAIVLSKDGGEKMVARGALLDFIEKYRLHEKNPL